ncbi:MAG: extracellular solute-binding protein [Lachnospiraceae bacterium]|jgi:raffinose/stachyose/melibiose transport system substrate-binding protein|nr:extracellular solute-binding protein [Lachnospiraceae bacterium]
MRKMRDRLLAMGLVTAMCISMCACSSGAATGKAGDTDVNSTKAENTEKVSQESAEEITLNVWMAACVSEDEKKQPQDEWLLTELCNEFEEQNPGVKIELTLLTDQGAAHQNYKAAALAKSGPDIINLWTGQPIFALADVVMDISDMIPEEDKQNIVGWETVTEGFEEGGRILGYPVAGSEVCGFIYNKELVAQAGVDLEKEPPRTVDEFMAMLQKIKDAGILPIAVDDASCNSLVTMSLAHWWVQKTGNENIAKESQGELKFAEDENFKRTFEIANEIYEKGYVNEDYASSQDALTRFLQGKAAMYGGTTSYPISQARDVLGEDNVGFYTAPDIDSDVKVSGTSIGGPGQMLAIANYCPHPEMALKFCSFLNSKETQLRLLKQFPQVPIRKDISVEELGWESDEILKKIYGIGQNYSYWSDNTMVPDVANECFSLGTLVVTGKMTPDELAQKLDEKAAELQ